MRDDGRVVFSVRDVDIPSTETWDVVKRVLGTSGLVCPARGALFRPCLVPFWIRIKEQDILVFGRRGSDEGLGIDGEGRVVNVLEGKDFHGIQFINSDILRFSKSVEWFSRRFPIAAVADSCIGDLDDEADALKRELMDIDPPCMDTDTFWETIYWDVTIGDWCGEEVGDCEDVDWELYQKDSPPWWEFPGTWLSPSFDRVSG